MVNCCEAQAKITLYITLEARNCNNAAYNNKYVLFECSFINCQQFTILTAKRITYMSLKLKIVNVYCCCYYYLKESESLVKGKVN